MSGTILYSAELDLAEADIPAFSAWYAGRHAADLYQSGFTVCTCYRAVRGGMDLIDFYEAPSWDVFESPAYRAIGPRDVYGPPLMKKRTDKAHTVYDYKATAPGSASGPFSADWITFARFAATPEDAQKLAAALSGPDGAALIAAGASRVRLAERGRDHPRNPTHRPPFILIAEWNREPPGDDTGEFVAARIATSGLDRFMGFRLYPWPDTPRS